MKVKTIKSEKLKMILLSIAMVLAMVPSFMMSAVDNVWAENYVAQIGSTKYETLAEALKAAETTGTTIEILDGTWGSEAIGTLTIAEKAVVRYKSITIQPATGADVTFTSDVSLGYDDSSTANASITVKNLKFSNASLLISNYVTVSVDSCSFSGTNSGVPGALVVQDSCCINHKTEGDYPQATVTITNCTIDGTGTNVPGIRIRNSGNVTISKNTIKNTKHNGILFESNTSVNNDANVPKTITITRNTIKEWNASNIEGGGRAIRLSLAKDDTLPANSKITIEKNVMTKETLGLDSPDFIKTTEAGTATVSLENNNWNGKSLEEVSGKNTVYSVDGATPSITKVNEGFVAKNGDNYYRTIKDAVDNAKDDDVIELLAIPAEEAGSVKTDKALAFIARYSSFDADTDAEKKELAKDAIRKVLTGTSPIIKVADGNAVLDGMYAVSSYVCAGTWPSLRIGDVSLHRYVTTTYFLTVDGKLTTEGASEAKYNVKYDPSSKTLTLKDATIEDYYNVPTLHAGGGGSVLRATTSIFANTDLNIVLVGKNTITNSANTSTKPDVPDVSTNVYSSHGIYMYNGDLNISGDGELKIQTADLTSIDSNNIGIRSLNGDVSVKDSKLTIVAGTAQFACKGIYTVKGDISFKDCTAKITTSAIDANSQYNASWDVRANVVIHASRSTVGGEVLIENSDVEATCGGYAAVQYGSSIGIGCYKYTQKSGNVTVVSNEAKYKQLNPEATSYNSVSSMGIRVYAESGKSAGNVDVLGGSLSVTTKDADSTYGTNYGIYAGGINVDTDGKVEISAGKGKHIYGVCNTASEINITGGDFSVTTSAANATNGYNYGVYSYYDVIVNTDGDVDFSAGSGYSQRGVYSKKALKILGGNCTISTADGNTTSGYNYAVSSSGVTVNTDGIFKVSAGSALYTYGLSVSGAVNCIAGDMSVTTKDATGQNIGLYADSLSMETDGDVSFTIGAGPSVYGVYAAKGALDCESGTFSLTTKDADLTSGYNYGIYAKGINFTSEKAITVEVGRGYDVLGVFSTGNINITDDKASITCVDGSASSIALYGSASSNNITVDITDGYYKAVYPVYFDDGYGNSYCSAVCNISGGFYSNDSFEDWTSYNGYVAKASAPKTKEQYEAEGYTVYDDGTYYDLFKSYLARYYEVVDNEIESTKVKYPYTVEPIKYNVQVGSYGLSADGKTVISESVSNVKGGGKVRYDGVAKLEASTDMTAYVFEGWSTKTVNDKEETVYTPIDGATASTYSFTPTKDCTIVARYRATEETFALNIEADEGRTFQVTINGTAQDPSTTSFSGSYPVGTVVSVQYTDTTVDEEFQSWNNETNKIMSRDADEYEFVLGSKTDLKAVTSVSDDASKTVTFETDSDQLIKQATADKEGNEQGKTTTITLPSAPPKSGYTFDEKWTVQGDETGTVIESAEELQTYIKDKFTEGSGIVLVPKYTEEIKVKVKLYAISDVADAGVDDSRLLSEAEIISGTSAVLDTEGTLDGKQFTQFVDSEGNKIGTNPDECIVYVSGTEGQVFKFYAVFNEDTVKEEPLLGLVAYQEVSGSANYIKYSSTRSLPNGYSHVDHGIVYSTKSGTTVDELTLENADDPSSSVYKTQSSDTKDNGVYILHFNVTGHESYKVYARAYVTYKDEGGKLHTQYSTLINKSFNELA